MTDQPHRIDLPQRDEPDGAPAPESSHWISPRTEADDNRPGESSDAGALSGDSPE